MMPIVVVVMGVAGVGKTTIGSALAQRLGWTFLEADDDHPAANIEKMSRGEPLTDDDRDGWIHAVADRIARRIAARENVVVACSALRRAHRDVLESAAPHVEFVHLTAPPHVVAGRLASRTGHFAGPELLPSQLADLEQPDDALVVDATLPVPELLDRIVEALNL